MAKKLLIKNSLFGITQFSLTAILALFSVPIFIHHLGMEMYGVYAVISIIGNLNNLTNFGLNGALLVYLAKQGKNRQSDHDIIVTQTIVTTISLLFILSVYLLNDFILQTVFSIPKFYLNESRNLLLLLTCSSVILILGQQFTAIIDSKQKIFISKICQFVYSLIYWCGMIAAVTLGGQLTAIGQVALASAITWFFLVLVIAGKIWGRLDLTDLTVNFKKTARKQFSYGSKIYLAAVSGFMFEPLSKVLISQFIGLQTVAFYEIGTKIKNQVSGVFSTALYPLLPFIANTNDITELNTKLSYFSKILQLFVLPAAIITVFVLPILTKYWIGTQNYQEVTLFIVVLTASMMIFWATIQPIYLYLEAKNKADKNMWIQLISVTINLIIFLLLYKKLGIYTILLSNSLGYFASYILGYYYQQKYLKVTYKDDVKYFFKLLIFGGTCFSFCLLIQSLIDISLWDIFIYPGVVGVLFILYILNQKLITKADLKLLSNEIPIIKNRLLKLLNS